jgi:hypothetical protein
MNRRLSWWLYNKATKAVTEVLGEEELESLKSDLLTPVKIAAKEAIEDFMNEEDGEDD